MKFDHLPEFVVDGSDSEEYGTYVKRISQLVKKPYFAMHKIFEREGWSLDEIKRSHHNAVNYTGAIPRDVLWWSIRKKRNEK